MKTVHPRIPDRVNRLHAYVPGEQPKIAGLVKLNTNENPYPPSPKVLAAVREAVDDRLRLYPDPAASKVRAALASFHDCSPRNIIVGNGSDELLALAIRAFVEPEEAMPEGNKPNRTTHASRGQSWVQALTPSYSLYPVLAASHGTIWNEFPLAADFSLPDPLALRRDQRWNRSAALTFVTTPNAPSGRGYTASELDALCALQRGIVVLDEAYVDFAAEHAAHLALKFPHVLVARTFSKAYSLCFLRIGYMIGQPALIDAMHKLRDSYNVNGLAQAAARATLQNLGYYRRIHARIRKSRDQLARALTGMGFEVLPSAANFLLARPPRFTAAEWLSKLRQERILVRWFDQPRVRDYLRITIGTETEMRQLVKVIQRLLQ